MLLQLGKQVAKGYLLLLTVAAGGFVAANVAGFAPGIMEVATNTQRAPDPGIGGAWVDGGWIVGAALFFVGTVGRTFRSMRKDVQIWNRLAILQRSSRGVHGHSKPGRFLITVGSRPCSLFGSIGVGGLVGAILGLMLGGSFLLLWFSIAYSPFAPDAWTSTIR